MKIFAYLGLCINMIISLIPRIKFDISLIEAMPLENLLCCVRTTKTHISEIGKINRLICTLSLHDAHVNIDKL